MRIEDKLMNNGKLQAKQDKLKSLHCPSPQSSLFNSRGSSLSSRLSPLISHSPVPNPDQSAKSLALNPQHSKGSATRCLQNSDESATRCSQHSSERATRCPQHNDELAARSPQHLFIDVSTKLLRQGKNVRFQAPGQSMHPAIREGETITVAPIAPFDIKRGDILLYIVGKKIIAHRVVSIKRGKNDPTSHSAASLSTQSSTQTPSHSLASFATRIKTQSTAHSTANYPTYSSIQASTHSKVLRSQLIFILRGDASLTCDDPVEAQQILGKVVSSEKNGRSIDLYSRKARMHRLAYIWASRLKRFILRKWDQIFIFDKKHREDLL